jgi:16S rRNA (guanine(966)-N(2))-methyltransferase RsmD
VRIVAGTHRGRIFNPPANLPVRPTTDFAKESLFNILNNYFHFSELRVLDLFSGTGSIAYEFASRGAKDITAVDGNFKCFSFIKETADKLRLDAIKVIKSDVFSFLGASKKSYDVIFADPPYDLEKMTLIPGLVFKNNLLNEGGWLVIEHSVDTDFTNHEHYLEQRRYSNTIFSIFTISKEEGEEKEEESSADQ